MNTSKLSVEFSKEEEYYHSCRSSREKASETMIYRAFWSLSSHVRISCLSLRMFR